MKRFGGFFLFLIFIFLPVGNGATLSYVKAETEDVEVPRSKVIVIEVDEEIKAGTAQFISRILKRAEEEGVDAFIMKLNTPGGLLGATEEISKRLIESDVKTVVYVYRPGGWAFSAGSFILLSADISAGHPSASIGAASPVGMDGEQAGEKILNATAGWIRSLAESSGKNKDLAEKLVVDNLTLSSAEAKEGGLMDIIALSLEDLLIELEMEGARISFHEQNFFDKVLSFVSLPYLVPLFLSLGLLGLFLVFRSGEIESVGLLGVVFLLLGLWGMGSIELSILGFLLLFLGLSLLIFEIFFTPADFGISGLVGVVALFFGIVTFANEPFFPGYLGQLMFWVVVGISVALGSLFVLIGGLTTTALKRPVQFGPESYRGRQLIVKEGIDPVGIVDMDGEKWNAKSVKGEVIFSGEKVRVVDLKGNTIIVDKIIN